MRTAVVGHVEWVECALVERVPRAGEIAHARESFEVPAGGGAVAAVQLARLAGECTFYTALGDDELGRRAAEELTRMGVRVEAAIRPGKSTRRGFAFLDDGGERTITVVGERLGPSGDDDELPWDELAQVDGVYFVAGDAAALRAARAAKAVVATARISDLLATAGVQLDAVVASAADVAERYRPFEPAPRYVAITSGEHGGDWTGGDGHSGRWQAVPLPGPVVDAYGAGDSFAAGLAYALGEGRDIDPALELAARCGATCMTGRGPYGRQLTASELERSA
jgi:ribokinase